MQKQTRKVYETVIDDPSRGSGAAGDCSHVIRSTSRATVEKAARGRTYYGAPAAVRASMACTAVGSRQTLLPCRSSYARILPRESFTFSIVHPFGSFAILPSPFARFFALVWPPF